MTGEVDRWITLDRGVGAVAFSPDGTKLVATTYAKDPDRSFVDHPQNVDQKVVPGPVPSRTGFTVVEVDSGEADRHKAPVDETEAGLFGSFSRADFDWNHDGTLVYSESPMEPFRDCFSLNGDRVEWPADEKAVGEA
jgi:hypothetical protein